MTKRRLLAISTMQLCLYAVYCKVLNQVKSNPVSSYTLHVANPKRSKLLSFIVAIAIAQEKISRQNTILKAKTINLHNPFLYPPERNLALL